MNGSVAILGGSGFVGRFLADRWPAGEKRALRFLLHRSRPEWLQEQDVDVRLVNLADPQGLRAAMNGATCLINLLRPDGSRWLSAMMQQLVPTLNQTSVSRLIHASSIDVYGATPEPYVIEETRPEPRTPYAREHFETENIVKSASIRTCIVRPGAIFGPGGRNVATFVSEMQNAPLWKLAARRSLYGHRRMHLVSVENVADAIRTIATTHDRTFVPRVIITDDEASENNFAFLQDTMARLFGRPTLDWVPEMPGLVLRAALLARGQMIVNPMRRFSNAKLLEIGFCPEQSFNVRLLRYVSFLKDSWGQPAE